MSRTFNPRRRILVAGQEISKLLTDDAISLSVEDHLEEADAAVFELSNRRNQWIDHPLFERGNPVQVFLGYGADPPRMFEGVIAVLEPHFPQDGVPAFTVTAYDRTYLMRKKGDRDEAYPERTLDEIVREVALKHGFREDDLVIESAGGEKRYFQQNSENDWDFLSRLAREEGFELYAELGRLRFRKPATKPDRVPGTFVYRENLLSFEPALTVDEAVSRVIVRGWDDQAKRAFQVEVDDPFAAERDVLGQQPASDFLSEAYGDSVRILHDVVAQSEAHARAIAMAYFRRKEFELITATGACVGDPELLAKRLIRVGGVGEKFSGDYYLTRVTHKFDDSGYLCDFEAKRNAISRIGTEALKDV
ncbi:MAG: contractile injection system protein, VgrG/Pvc8 family, partial [candidate division NC10 bacterium]